MDDRLAADGGTPAVKAYPPRKLIGAAERKAIVELVDRSIEKGLAFDRYGGTETDAYEKEFAAWLGTSHGTAVSSGTASGSHSAGCAESGAGRRGGLFTDHGPRRGHAGDMEPVHPGVC